MKLAERMRNLGTETAFEVLAKAKALEAEGKEIIHLEIGEPDFDTPEHIKEAAIKALRDGKTGYCPAAGIKELREAIAADAGARRGLSVSPEEVVVTPGAKPIMYFVITALVDPGDEVLYPDPGFPIYESVIRFVGGKPVPIPLREERKFSFDIDEFRALVSDRTKLIILNSPQNPTGGVLSKGDLEAIAEEAMARDIFVLSDEVYNNILYEGTFFSIASLPGMRERTVILDGLSKTYAMTGWRLGYGVMPRELARHVERLTINTVSCTSHFSQYGAIAAITGSQEPVAAMVAEFRRRRDFIVAGLNKIKGVHCVMPQGAFYAFPNIKGTGFSSKELERRLLEEAGVATLSGTAFGRYGDGYLRLSYANSLENIERALERFAALVS
ncbi:MAG: pyridoxal phosphate-dependent aminotransferase [candidate division KSB1 bacterium]|nr:pyridoxal phosphate-dependent aminotransferase [candidate division KSB1 bacterium]MDZ7294687.1 pyridoxal phosphate-dependent aminotransferase [candidate division KSB1 bacterium]MDZ7392578.1 pyridoxal phosphate-dependent aminotransferase [candidate division KSB1 bacterium]MDZ7413613.1 pyridoxal phosphate-dependent aminotransferase [candidate division KSB1 bacterium]